MLLNLTQSTFVHWKINFMPNNNAYLHRLMHIDINTSATKSTLYRVASINKKQARL